MSITTDHRESKRAYQVRHEFTEYVPTTISPEEHARREHERKRANQRYKIMQRRHYFRFTFEE